MTPRRDRLDALAIAILLLLTASWGFQQVTIKVANEGISPVLQAGLRSVGATLLVWGWSAARGQRTFERDGSLGIGILVGALFAGEFIFLYWGLLYTPASRGILFVYTAPFVVAVGAHFFIPGERLHRIHAIGLVCAFIGVAIAFEEGLRLPQGRERLGDSMELLAAVLWGATTVVIKATGFQRLAPAKVLFYQLACSALALPLVSLAMGEPGITYATPLVITCLAYQTIFVAFFTYLLWFWLIAHYPAAKLAAFSFLTPLFGILSGAIFLAEPLTGALAVAMVLVGAGIYLVNRIPRPLGGP
jgi:drug/metabolite transporter (DMT)-like permease